MTTIQTQSNVSILKGNLCFMRSGGKPPDGSPGDKQLALPMDTHNTRDRRNKERFRTVERRSMAF